MLLMPLTLMYIYVCAQEEGGLCLGGYSYVQRCSGVYALSCAIMFSCISELKEMAAAVSRAQGGSSVALGACFLCLHQFLHPNINR